MQRFACAFALGLGLLLTVESQPGVAADPCPKGVKEQSKNGSDGDEISWYSFATLAKIEDKDWCYHRKVEVRKPDKQYVNWPKGEIHKKVVEKEMTTRSCCYPDPRLEAGDIEHGYSGKKIPTQVYRGFQEPQQNETWTSIAGFIYLEPKTLRIDLTVRSSFRKTPEGFEYFYEIANPGDAVTAVWNSVDSAFFKGIIDKIGLSFPLRLKAGSDRLRGGCAIVS